MAKSWNTWLISEINKGTARPSDLYRAISIAPKRVLTKQLSELEKMGIVSKKIYPIIPLKVEYYLTEAGKSLVPIINELWEWGEKYKNILPEIK